MCVCVFQAPVLVCWRLESYDRNDNFSQEAVDCPPPVLTDWPVSGFWQLTLQLQSWVAIDYSWPHKGIFHTVHGLWQSPGRRHKSTTEGQQLLDSLRVQACSMLTEHCFAYFTGTVKAAMKKVDFFYSCQYHFVGQVNLCHCAAVRMSICTKMSIYVK